MSKETHELELLDHCNEIFTSAVDRGDKDNARRTLTFMEQMGLSDPVKESMEDALMSMKVMPRKPYIVEQDNPTQEDINGGFIGINSGNNG